MITAVDVHAHLAVPAADALLAGTPGFEAWLATERAAHSPESFDRNRAQIARIGPRSTDVETRLRDMDAMGVSHQVVGPMPRHHYWADESLAQRFTRVTNEAVKAHCANHRLVGIGTLPLQHPDLAVDELEHAVTDLGLKGISVSTFVEGKELADPAHDPIWAKAEELNAVVFVHPWGCTLGSRLADRYLANTVGNPVETAVALSHLIFTGTLDRFPRLRIVAAHGGGYLPTYAGRSDHAWGVRPDAGGCDEPPSAYLRRIWYDALVYTPEALRHLVEVVGHQQVMLGSDYPFDMGVTDPVLRLDTAGLKPDHRDAVAKTTAVDLFGLTP